MVAGRSKQAFKTWLAERPQAWRDGIEVVAMDGFTGFKTATTEELPDAVAVMDPFHVARLAGDALDRCRRRVQNDIHGQRGRKQDPLYQARRTLHTGADLLTDKQAARLTELFATVEHGAGHDVLTYLGVALSYVRDGSLEHQIWVPVGEEPTFADDERLISALHQALLWRCQGVELAVGRERAQ